MKNNCLCEKRIKYAVTGATILFLWLFLFVIPVSQAQNETQRLAELHKMVPKDSLVINEMLVLTSRLMEANPDSAAEYLKEIRQDAEELQYYIGLYKYAGQLVELKNIKCDYENTRDALESLLEKYESKFTEQQQFRLWTNLADLYADCGDSETALSMLNNNLKEADQDEIRAHILANRGNILTRKGSYKLAINDYLLALKYYDSVNDYSRAQVIYNNLGYINSTIENFREALKNYLTALQYAEKINDKHLIESSYSNIGTVYKQLNKPEEAIRYYEKALALSIELKSFMIQAQNLMNLGNIYEHSNQFKRALENYKQSLDICYANNISFGILLNYYNIGFIHYTNKAYTLALQSVDSAYVYAVKLGLPNEKSSIYELYSSIYEETGQVANALAYHKKFYLLHDSLFSVENQVAVREMEKKYQTEKKELENETLKAQLKNKEQKLLFRNIILIVVLIGIVVLGSLLFNSIRLYKDRGLAYDVLMNSMKKREEVTPVADDISIPDKKPGFEPNENEILFGRIRQLYEDEKLWLNPKLRVDDIAAQLGTSRKAIALALNKVNYPSFITFTNDYRVEFAKKLMGEPDYKNYKLEAIASMAGFGTKQQFHRVFQIHTGLKPSYYQKNLHLVNNDHDLYPPSELNTVQELSSQSGIV